MYTPGHFRSEDRAKITAVIRANSFATLTTAGPGGLTTSHLPFLYDDTAGPHGTLFAHMARANGQWREFPAEALVVFQGEHGYISPRWYAGYPDGKNVPTWNYESVHVYGVPRILTDPVRVLDVLGRTIQRYEPEGSGYTLQSHSEEFLTRTVQAIVAFEMPVSRVEAKFKLGQNRSKEDLASAIRALEQLGDSASRRLADAMRREQPH